MAARKKTSKAGSKTGKGRARATRTPGDVIANVQQIWLAGMGAIAKAHKEGPAAFQDAVAEGLELLTRSGSSAEQMIRNAFESAQGSVQTRLGSARDQATETWDNLETLFQSRVHKAMQQLGVPSADEIRLLTKRVAELNDNVKALSARRAGGRGARGTKASRAPAKRPAKRPARRKTRTRTAR
jgi:poly(hydroxyalkanoate) granule-associated protein